MRFGRWLVTATIIAMLAGFAHAAEPSSDSALEARIKALEKRVTELEQKLNAVESAERAAPAPAATAAAPAPASPAAPMRAAPPPQPAAPEPWRTASAWGQIRRGMSWSQVEDILGKPGSKTIGVFGDVWFYPDSSGGRVVFDRDSRVSAWTEPPGA